MRRRLLAATVCGWVVATACFPVAAQIYRCPDGDGFALQQSPCPGLGRSGGRLLVLPNGRPAPLAVPVGASGSASDVPGAGRVFGRSPLPSPLVARKSN